MDIFQRWVTNKTKGRLCGQKRDLRHGMGTWVELEKRKRVRDGINISPLAGTKAKPGKATLREEARSDCSGLGTSCPRIWGAFLCLQWALEMVWAAWLLPFWKRRAGFCCLCSRPSSFHCSGESKFAVISVPVIKLNVNLCWSSWKENWGKNSQSRQGESGNGNVLWLTC